MTKEQEEAINFLKNYKYVNEVKEAIDIVLAMLEEKDKQIAEEQKAVEQIYADYQDIGKIAFDYQDRIELLEKQINLMAEFIEKRIDSCPLNDYNYDLNCENKCNDDSKKCWKQYFENKAKEV